MINVTAIAITTIICITVAFISITGRKDNDK